MSQPTNAFPKDGIMARDGDAAVIFQASRDSKPLEIGGMR
jgi:hypothetical protein